jgi:hypothetical protein
LQLTLKRVKIIGGVRVAKVKASLFVTVLIAALNLSRFNTLPQNQKQSGSAPANKQQTNPCAMGVTQSCSTSPAPP